MLRPRFLHASLTQLCMPRRLLLWKTCRARQNGKLLQSTRCASRLQMFLLPVTVRKLSFRNPGGNGTLAARTVRSPRCLQAWFAMSSLVRC